MNRRQFLRDLLALAAGGLLSACGISPPADDLAPMPTRAATVPPLSPSPLPPRSPAPPLPRTPAPSPTPTLEPPPGLRIRPTTAPFTALPRPPITPEPTPIPSEFLVDYNCVTGENPLWHPMEQCVYWVDIPQGRLFRYYPSSRKHEMVLEDPLMIGGFTIQQDGALLLFMEHGAIKQWQDGRLTTVFEDIPDERDSRFNDVIADPEGRVYCGTMATGDRPGRLYRLEPDRGLSRILEGIGVPNGMAFSPDLQYFYFTDSGSREIYRFNYERSGGGLTDRRTLIRIPAGQGVPDGLTVDAAGYLWSARWDGALLARYTPGGDLDLTIPFAARKVSSVTFGGPAYTDIYVTTAGGDNKVREGSGAGALYRVQLGIKGKAEFYSRIRVA